MDGGFYCWFSFWNGAGTILNAVNEICPFPFCTNPFVPFPQSVNVPLHPNVKLLAAYGASLNDRSGGFSELNNKGLPFGVSLIILLSADCFSRFCSVLTIYTPSLWP